MKRNPEILLRLTKEEKREVEKAAKEQYMQTAVFCRMLILKHIRKED